MALHERFTILLVDDDAFVLEALSELFIDEYDVLVAGSGARAIDLVSHHTDIAAVVLDIKMADMDGVETYRRLKHAVPTLEIIIHTGYPGQYKEQQLDLMLEPSAYIQKGDPPILLKRAVRAACESTALHRKLSDSNMTG